MSAYYTNLALHVADATAKANRRLDRDERLGWLHVLVGLGSTLVGFVAVTLWLS